MTIRTLPTHSFGSTDRQVTRFGLGGEGILRTFGEEAAADAVISRAVDHGVSYFDSARAYAGSEAYYGRYWSKHPGARAKVFITSKSASRDAAGARRDLETTLSKLAVEVLDLWQLHDLRTDEDLKAIAAKGGAFEAFLEAKGQGRVRHLGVTGHHDPAILLKAIREFPVESVLLPINPVEGALGGFLTEVLPEARRRGLAVVGMKLMGAGHYLRMGLDASRLLRYALAQGADTLIVGCSTPEEVDQNVAITSEAPMSQEEAATLVDELRPYVERLAFYRGRL